MENFICLDSDILIDLLRGNEEVVDWIKDNEDKAIFSTTIINLFELYTGANKSSNPQEKVKAVDILKSKIKILDFNIEVSKKAGEEKAKLEINGQDLEIRDLLIGVIARTNGYSIKTNNKKHFSRINGLKIV